APNVTYEIVSSDGDTYTVKSPAEVPDPSEIEEFREPIVRNQMVIPGDSVGNIMQLCEDKRGTFRNQEYLSKDRVILTYDLPLAEILYDFFDKLKSGTRGYGTMDYEFIGYVPSDLVKMTILINKVSVDALSVIMHRDRCERRGRSMLTKLRKEIPKQMFEVPLQAAIGGRVIARETIKAMRKDVHAKCYGGDISRKRKLLDKQKEGKKRMKAVGSVELPQEAFLTVLKVDT
ncbi:MAG: elongation factor 4, partial [Deltaproteobacteria bacterium]|nr:elongation factor 4 [Kofleriaceae bacterium]